MEDAHFVKEIPQGLIAGVFDGHGGQEIALYAAQQFANRFSQQLIRSEGNVHHALETLLYQIHEEASGKHDWMLIGSTALVCFFDPRSHIVYTATIGDSEAHIYRSLEGKTQSIPLSCVRNWSFEHEARRVAIALKKPAIAKIWPHAKRPKTLRYPLGYGLNVSRAIGDSFAREMSNPSAIIAKPKISIHILNPQDVVVLTCDGVKDFVEDSEIIALVDEDKKLLAQKITSYAINKKNSTDNVTVVVIDVE
jgi:serine/threonine protein phosphatase PrpC